MVSVSLSSLPMFASLRLEALEVCDERIVLHVASTTTSAPCPECAVDATGVHSTYTRTLADLPWCGWAVRLRLRVRRFFCRTPSCSRTTFVEQIPSLTRPYAQHTSRLNDLLRGLGLALGGEAGHRFSHRLALTVSPDTLLRRVRQLPPPAVAAPEIIGVDEWAKRKGRHYGAIVVDLERHQVLDLLPDDSAEQFATWLKEHPGVRVIARDRANTFAQGAQQGAPSATQVADRWHLTRNLGDALETLLQRHTRALRDAAEQLQLPTQLHTAELPDAPGTQPTQATPLPSEVVVTAPEQPVEVSVDTSAIPAWPDGHSYGPSELRQEQFQRAKQLHQQGWSYRQIAQHLHLNWRTAKKYVQADMLPRRILPQTTSSLTPYAPTIQAVVAAGTQTGIDLWRELQTQGYRGSLSSVYRVLKHLQPEDQRRVRRARGSGGSQHSAQTVPVTKPRQLSARQAKWLLVRQEEKLKAEEVNYRERLCALCPDVATAYPLAQEFMRIIRERDGARLDGWLADVQASGVRELKQFAKSLLRDEAAVRGALDTAWSTGQVEGQINRLKLVKRTMYGRGSFEVLRQRVMNAA